MNRRLWIFILIFTGINLIFIPLLSLYGLRVCPVLSIPGFGFGCYYSAAYIIFANFLNILLILLFRSQNPSNATVLVWLKRYPIAGYAITYLIATGVALVILQVLLHSNHLSQHSRAPEILALASFLLGVTQAYGLNWALRDSSGPEESAKVARFHKFWLSHIFRTMLPIGIAVAVLLHFLISQSLQFNDGRTAPVLSHDELIAQTSYVVYFLITWILVTFSFHFLSERDHVATVQSHLDHLHRLDIKYRSNPSQAWGLWSAIIYQLNSFSKVLGERTRLLKSFSRFVTAGVAEQALHEELKKTSGTVRELTVIMSDIRNFTAMSELLSPDQVVLLLNEYFSAMLDVIAGSQINVDKFIGDGILAYVDVEQGETSDSLKENRAGVDAALAMIQKLEELNVKLMGMGLPIIKIGIGIYRGPLVMGLIGSEAKLQHTIIGDTVNRTARLESLCKDLGVSIVISGHVWHSLDPKKQILFKSFGKQVVKGIAGPMEVFGK